MANENEVYVRDDVTLEIEKRAEIVRKMNELEDLLSANNARLVAQVSLLSGSTHLLIVPDNYEVVSTDDVAPEDETRQPDEFTCIATVETLDEDNNDIKKV